MSKQKDFVKTKSFEAVEKLCFSSSLSIETTLSIES